MDWPWKPPFCLHHRLFTFCLSPSQGCVAPAPRTPHPPHPPDIWLARNIQYFLQLEVELSTLWMGLLRWSSCSHDAPGREHFSSFEGPPVFVPILWIFLSAPLITAPWLEKWLVGRSVESGWRVGVWNETPSISFATDGHAGQVDYTGFWTTWWNVPFLLIRQLPSGAGPTPLCMRTAAKSVREKKRGRKKRLPQSKCVLIPLSSQTAAKFHYPFKSGNKLITLGGLESPTWRRDFFFFFSGARSNGGVGGAPKTFKLKRQRLYSAVN